MLARGTKILSPHVRATSKNGTIHAVERSAGEQASTKSLCGKVTVQADWPLRRFQQGLGKECARCTTKVAEARAKAIKDRKALRSLKNQPQAKAETEAVVMPMPAKPKRNRKPAAKSVKTA